MAVRVADSIKQTNDLKTFPVAYSEDIWLDENKGEGDANFKDLQTLFNENKLGGSGLPEPESADKVLLSASSNTRADGLEWKQVSKNDVGLQLPEFESLEEWDSLPADEKSKYYNAGKGYVVIKEDVKGAKGIIDDTKPNSTVTTLSAKKISDEFSEVNVNLGEKADKFINKFEANKKYVDIINFICQEDKRNETQKGYAFLDEVGRYSWCYFEGSVKESKGGMYYGNLIIRSLTSNFVVSFGLENTDLSYANWKMQELVTMDNIPNPFLARGAILDVNNAINPGVWITTSQTENFPSDAPNPYGIVTVYGNQTNIPSASAQWIFQQFESTFGGRWVRKSINPNSLTPTNWDEWVKIG